MMRKIFLLISVVFVCVSCAWQDNENTNADDVLVEEQKVIEYEYDVIEKDKYQVETKCIRSGESLSNIMKAEGVDVKIINALSTLSCDVFDVRMMRAGNEYFVYYANDSAQTPHYIVYEKNKVDYTVFHVKDSLFVRNYSKPVVVQECLASVTINTSLWVDVVDKDLNPQLALDLSDIFAWSIDFFALQKGDSFIAEFTEEYVDSLPIGIGKIRSAVFSHAGKDYHAIYFEKDDVKGYWDLYGNSTRKAFLKAPLSFSRISSGFTYARKHPVYKTVRPHTGVDYAAPTGTPVMTIGDGVVEWVGYKGGGGHTVKIKHNGTYSSAYLHLSKYGKGIKKGSRVSQGQVIGYVGSTGASTGAHLDFRVWKNGQPINPLKMESPPSEPIPQKYKAEFDSIKNIYLEKVANSRPLKRD